MSRPELAKLSISELAEAFRTASAARGLAILDSDNSQSNKLLSTMRIIDEELRSRGKDARLSLASLLEDENVAVRYFAANYLLGLVSERAREVIEQIAAPKVDAISLEAGMCLYILDKGIYKPD